MNIDELAQAHQHDHTGYQLTDWYEAAFPTYTIFVQVQMIEQQNLPYVEQFTLRTLDAGMRTSEEVSNVLGLEQQIVYATLERLLHLGSVVIINDKKSQAESISLTKKGRKLLQDLVIQQPIRETIDFCIDALTGEYFHYRNLLDPKNVRMSELHAIPIHLPKPHVDSLDLVAMRRLWDTTRRSMPPFVQSREIFDILELDKTFVGFRVMRVLQFIRPEDRKLQVHVYDGSERSPAHEAMLIRLEAEQIRVLRAEKRVGPEHVDDPAIRLIDTQEYAAAQRRAAEVPRLEAEIARREQKIRDAEEHKRSSRTREELAQATGEINELTIELAQLRAQVDELVRSAPRTEVLSMVEHRPRLLQAFKDAKQRIIIVSPWLTRKAVNWELREAIGIALARGVHVIIGYGFDKESDREEKQTLENLELLQRGRGGRYLQLERIGESHAKVLICDDAYVITTSFNWLSFAGRADWGNRIEFGTQTSDTTAVRKMLDELGSLFKHSTIETLQQ